MQVLEENTNINLPYPTGAKLDLSKYHIEEYFTLYKLPQQWNFETNLDFEDKIGVYIFTYKIGGIYHKLIYRGKTEHLNKRFYDHCNRHCIMEHHADYIAIHYCETNEMAESIERKILKKIDFPCNSQNNQNCENSTVTAEEVSIIR